MCGKKYFRFSVCCMLSGAAKRKKKNEEQERKQQRGALHKFLLDPSKPTSQPQLPAASSRPSVGSTDDSRGGLTPEDSVAETADLSPRVAAVEQQVATLTDTEDDSSTTTQKRQPQATRIDHRWGQCINNNISINITGQDYGRILFFKIYSGKYSPIWYI